MHPNSTPAPAPRNDRLLRQVHELETLLRRGWFIEFYDPHGTRHGIPTYPFHWAPSGLLTIRQLRAKGLRPGGQDVVAQILWRHRKHRRVAYLYREDLALPKRQATPAQLPPSTGRCTPAAPAPPAASRRPTTSRAQKANATTAQTGGT